jgi:hypothetical protein
MESDAIVLLGAYHGINPGMGWLFAVALGMQEGSARGVWRALPPLAFGHALAVGVVLAVAALLQMLLPGAVLKNSVAVGLMTLGLYRLCRHRHPRFGGMRVGFRDLTIWSFLMASAHGAGLMLFPFVMPLPMDALAAAHAHAAHVAATTTVPFHGGPAIGIHTLTYFGTTALVAQVVYRKLGLRLLRTAWFNMDWAWAVALLVTGAALLLS